MKSSPRVRKVFLVSIALCLFAMYIVGISFPRVMDPALVLILPGAILTALTYSYLVLRMRTKASRTIAIAVPTVLLIAAFVLAIPGICRANYTRRVHQLGGEVHIRCDKGDGVWFRYCGLWVPISLRDQLGEAFFGEITDVSFHRTWSRNDFQSLPSGVSTPTINFSSISFRSGDLAIIARCSSTKHLHFANVDFPNNELRELSGSGGLSTVSFIQCGIDHAEIQTFATANPTVQVGFVRQVKGVWSFVRLPP